MRNLSALLLCTVMGMLVAAGPAGTAEPDKPLQTGAGDQLGDLGPRRPAKPAPASALPRGPDGRPDFTGIWFAGIRDFVTLDDRRIEIPLTPDFAWRTAPGGVC